MNIVEKFEQQAREQLKQLESSKQQRIDRFVERGMKRLRDRIEQDRAAR